MLLASRSSTLDYFQALVLPDSGCTVSTIPVSALKYFDINKIRKLHHSATIADGRKVWSMGTIKLTVSYKNTSTEVHFLVYNDRTLNKCLLSMETCKKLMLIPEGYPFTQLSG